MRTTKLIVSILLFFVVFYSCQQEVLETLPERNQPQPDCTTPYIFKLEGEYPNADAPGTWTWVWSVYNPNPGNGTGGTAQNMSHWGFRVNSCFNWPAIESADFSFDSTNWTSFTPTYGPDNGQICTTDSVFKFNAGTSGTAKTYFRIILTANYSIDS